MTHCLGSLASWSNASSARTADPCTAVRPKTDVVTTKSLFIASSLGVSPGGWLTLLGSAQILHGTSFALFWIWMDYRRHRVTVCATILTWEESCLQAAANGATY